MYIHLLCIQMFCRMQAQVRLSMGLVYTFFPGLFKLGAASSLRHALKVNCCVLQGLRHGGKAEVGSNNNRYVAACGLHESCNVQQCLRFVTMTALIASAASWKLWVPAHIFNFAFVPTEQRILYANLVSVRSWPRNDTPGNCVGRLGLPFP